MSLLPSNGWSSHLSAPLSRDEPTKYATVIPGDYQCVFNYFVFFNRHTQKHLLVNMPQHLLTLIGIGEGSRNFLIQQIEDGVRANKLVMVTLNQFWEIPLETLG